MTRVQTEYQKWRQAVEKDSFLPIVAYPKLLNGWAKTHNKDVMQISKIAAHRIRNHTWCGDKCRVIDKWTKLLLITQIAQILSRVSGSHQERLF